MRGVRFINQIYKEFNLKVVFSFEGISPIFGRMGRVTYYSLNSIYGIWFSKHKIAFYKDKETCVKIMSISEKHKILQLISEALSK